MLERKKLNKLVVFTIKHSDNNPIASQIYDAIKERKPEILRLETVRSFRSFVKIINSFDQIEGIGSRVKKYSLKDTK
jgi:transposase-like protein